MSQPSTNRLSQFLKTLASRLDNNTLTHDQTVQICQFFVKWQFDEQATKDSAPKVENTDNDDDISVEDDFINFLTMGWYVYSILNNESN